jgi:hypothetical protein
MTRTVNLLYYQRQEMAESPKKRTEFGNSHKMLYPHELQALSTSQFKQSSEMFEGQKERQSLETCLLSLSRSPFSLYSSSLSLNMVLVQANRILSIFHASPNPNPNQIGIQTQCLVLLYTTEYCRRSAKLFLQSAEMGPSPPPTPSSAGECAPFWFRGRHSR